MQMLLIVIKILQMKNDSPPSLILAHCIENLWKPLSVTLLVLENEKVLE